MSAQNELNKKFNKASPGAPLAMGPSPSRAVSVTDIQRLDESFKKVVSYFGQHSPTLFCAMTVALLKENDYDAEVVQRKVLESDKDLKQLSSLKYPHTLAPSPPSSYTPTYVGPYGSPSPSLLSSAFHPSLYPPLLPGYTGYSFYHQGPAAAGFPLPTPPEPTSPVVAAAASLAYYPGGPPDVVRFTPPVRPGEASGGDSRGSADYSDKDGGGPYDASFRKQQQEEAAAAGTSSFRKRPLLVEQEDKELDLTSASIENLRKRSRKHMFEHYGGLAMSLPDMRETAANA